MRLFFCAILFFLSGAAFAQLREFEITSVPPSGPIPVFRDHPDKVAVIFRSSLTNLRFDSNLGVTANLSEASKGEYVLILNPVRQSVTVNAAGFKQERVQITLTEPRQVAYYRIEPKPQVATNLIPTIIQVTPADAFVSIDGVRVDFSKPVPIEVGTHMVRMEKQGFRTIEKEILINAEQNLIRETLTAIDVVPLTIKTHPAGATVLLDGVQVGVTDRNGDIGLFRFPGTYELSVQLSGHVPETRTITVNETGPNATSITMIRNAGTLRLTVTPSDATVLLNRQPHNPSQPADLAPGMVLVEVSKADHDPHSETVEILRGQTSSRSITLTPHLGGFQITPTPLQASWSLTNASGRVVMSGTGLARKADIPVGTYKLTTRASGYQEKVETVRIERGKISEWVVGLSVSRVSEPVVRQNIERHTPSSSPISLYMFIGGQAGILNDLTLDRRLDYTQKDLNGNTRSFTSDFELSIEPEGMFWFPTFGLGVSVVDRLDISAAFGANRVPLSNPSNLWSTSLQQPYVTLNSLDLRAMVRLGPSTSEFRGIVGGAMSKVWLSTYENFAYNTVTRDYNRVEADLAYTVGGLDLIGGVEYNLLPFRLSVSYRHSTRQNERKPLLAAELAWVF